MFDIQIKKEFSGNILAFNSLNNNDGEDIDLDDIGENERVEFTDPEVRVVYTSDTLKVIYAGIKALVQHYYVANKRNLTVHFRFINPYDVNDIVFEKSIHIYYPSCLYER